MKMFFRLPIALLVIFLASNSIAVMDQRIPEDQIGCAAQRFVSTLLAVKQPPYETELLATYRPRYLYLDDEELNDESRGLWMGYLAMYRDVSATIIVDQSKTMAKIAPYYFDPEFNKWLAIKKISQESPDVQNPYKQHIESLSWSVPARVPYLYSEILCTLVNSYSISHQDYEKVFLSTSYRLSNAIIRRVTQGFWYPKLISPLYQVYEPYNHAGLEYENDSLDDDLKVITDYNKELHNWHATHGVAERTDERISAAGVREMAMCTYKSAGSL